MYKILKLHVTKWEILLLLGDVGVYLVAVIIGLVLNPKVTAVWAWAFLAQYHFSVLLMGLTYLVVFYIADLYDYRQDFRRWGNIARVIFSIWIGTLAVILIFYFPFGVFIGRILLVIQSAIFTGLMVLWRWSFSSIALPQRLKRKLLIVGVNEDGRSILEAIRKQPHYGLEVVGFLDDDPHKSGSVIDGLPVVVDQVQLKALLSQHQVSVVVVARFHDRHSPLINTLARTCWTGCQRLDLPSFYEFLMGKMPIEYISDIWLYLYGLQTHRLYYRHLKRVMDVGLAVLGLTLCLPMLAVIFLAIKLDSRGPVFFRQERLGQYNQPFEILKFRTMRQDAERSGPQWTRENDRRITRVGKVLRKLRMDEWPQLINILKGDMSFIGPRPEREIFITQFQELIPDLRQGRRGDDPAGLMVQLGFKERIPHYSYRLLLKPGLTGWAQVMQPYAGSLEETREKVEYDLYYTKNISFFLDLVILLKTIRIVVFGRGR
jgi:exopolysaccharide biosynthesis polyprenyl glycosylphosphotransferase